MKKNLFFKSLLIAVVGLSLSYGFYQLSGSHLKDFCKEGCASRWVNSGYQTFNQSISFVDVDSLEIHTLDSDVNIHSNKANNGKIDLTTGKNAEKTISIKKINHTLLVNVSNTKYNESSVNITLPNTVKNLKVSTLKGDVSMEKLKLAQLTIETTAGDIELRQVDATKTNIKSISGDVEWDGSSTFANINTVSGDIKFNSSKDIKGTVLATSVTGDVTVPKIDEKGEDEIRMNTVNGDIFLEDNYTK